MELPGRQRVSAGAEIATTGQGTSARTTGTSPTICRSGKHGVRQHETRAGFQAAEQTRSCLTFKLTQLR
jgi:hypothetical protein